MTGNVIVKARYYLSESKVSLLPMKTKDESKARCERRIFILACSHATSVYTVFE